MASRIGISSTEFWNMEPWEFMARLQGYNEGLKRDFDQRKLIADYLIFHIVNFTFSKKRFRFEELQRTSRTEEVKPMTKEEYNKKWGPPNPRIIEELNRLNRKK